MKIAIFSILLWVLQCVSATRQLKANALVPCQGAGGITAKEFSILYDHPSRTVYYNASVNIVFDGRVYAEIELWIYGLRAISTRLDPCDGKTQLKELCPVHAGSIDLESNSKLSESITKHIPGVAFTVPDIDAYVIAKVRNATTGSLAACVMVEVKNTKTVEQTAVKWVTAVLSGLGLLVSALLVFLGTSVDSHNISAVTVLMFNYFQSMAFLDMQAVERVPPIVSAWCDNIAWSVGLVYSAFLEKIFRWYVQATGGDPATYRLYPTKTVLVQKLRKRATELINGVSPRSMDYLRNMKTPFFTPEGELTGGSKSALSTLSKRADAGASEAYASSSQYLVVYRGIERLSYKMGIEVTSAVITTYTIFVFICVCVVFVFAVLWFLLGLYTRKQRAEHDRFNEKSFDSAGQEAVNVDTLSTTFTSYEGPMSRASYFYHLVPALLKGTLLKLWYVSFPAIMVFSMWEWTHNDSAAVVVVSVFMFLICLVLLLCNVVRVYIIARNSKNETGTPAYMLYANARVLQKYGYLYSMFDIRCYYFGVVYMVYNFVKAAFLAFAQKSGKTQALAIFIIELAMFIAVAHLKPFLSRAVNGIQITAHVIITINACFFLFFSNLMTQPLIVNGVMGVVFFVLNAAFSLVLLLYIIIYSTLCIIWHKRQGARADHYATDDRNSFILDRHGRTADEADELQALGKAAQADHNDADIGAQSSAWFKNDSTAAQNPFDPAMDPPTPQQRADRHSNFFPESRTYTMTSETSALNYPGAFTELSNNGHRINDSQISFSKGDSSSDLMLEGPTKRKGFTNLFKRK